MCSQRCVHKDVFTKCVHESRLNQVFFRIVSVDIFLRLTHIKASV